MEKSLKKRFIISMLIVAIVCATFYFFNPRKAKAEASLSSDWMYQDYKLYDKSITYDLVAIYPEFWLQSDGTDTRYIFRIDCPDLSETYPELSEQELVAKKYIYFNLVSGRLWFVNGEVKYSGEDFTDMVEVLYYDSGKNQVYVRFDFSAKAGDGSAVDTELVQRNREQGAMYYVAPEDIVGVGLLKERIVELEQRLVESGATNSSLMRDIKLLEQSVANLEDAYDTLTHRYETLNNQYLSALTAVEELETAKNQAIEDKLAEIMAHKETRENLEAQISERDGNIEELTLQLEEINATLTKKEQELKGLQDSYADLERQYEELYAEYQAFLESAAGNEEAIAGLLHEYKIAIAQLEKQVQELTEERDALKEEQEKSEQLKGCQASGCSAGGSGGIGSGIGSAVMPTAMSLSLFGVMLYVKRKKVKE